MQIVIIYRMKPHRIWKEKIERNAAIVEKLFSSEAFKNKIRVTLFEYSKGFFNDGDSVVDKLELNDSIRISVGFWHNWFTRAIARETSLGIDFNTAKKSAGSAGDIAHEIMHQIGFKHFGNSWSGNQNTVPYKIGNMVSEEIGE